MNRFGSERMLGGIFTSAGPSGRDRATSARTPATAGEPARGRHVIGGRDRRAARPLSAPPGPRGRAGARSGPAAKGRLRAASLALSLTVAVGLGGIAAGDSAAETTRTRSGYAPAGTSGWRNDGTLGRTDRADQYAQANVSGLRDDRYSAGFRLRYTDRDSHVLVAVSGTGWLVQPSGGTALTGTFAHGPSGLFRAEIEGRTVRVRWNGVLVASRQIPGDHRGRHVVSTVRQPTQAVAMRLIRASSLPRTAALPAPAAAGGAWLSGAASDQAATGTFGAWRGSPVQIGGTWTDTFEAQTDQWQICGGAWSRWDKPLDLAVGAIYRNRKETWSAAARGAYTARWTTALTRIKTCWGKRDPANLYLRFAHELNLSSMPWAVRKGEEKDFIAAMRIFSDLRYRILPKAKLVLCVNDGTDGALGGLDVRNLWPGKDAAGRPVANVYAADSYNFWPHATTRAAFLSKINATYPNGAPKGIERHRQFAATLGVPFAVSEWSNSGDPRAAGGGGESEVYVREFNAWARANGGDVANPRPGQLLYEVHFNLWTQYAFWPKTIQPRTASAYRSVPWGR